MKVFKITDPIFKTEPLFIGNCSYQQMTNYLRKNFNIHQDGDAPGIMGRMLTFRTAPYRVVYVKKFAKSGEYLGAMVHEIFHLVTRVCEDKGIPIYSHISTGECGDEAAAYLLEFYLNNALKKI